MVVGGVSKVQCLHLKVGQFFRIISYITFVFQNVTAFSVILNLLYHVERGWEILLFCAAHCVI